MENAIEAGNLTKYFGDVLAVNHINVEVKKGEIFGFLGPNGAGKTTTIRMLTGLTDPSEGTARIMGHDIQKEPFRAKECFGIVPEVSNVYDDFSAWNNLMFAGELYGISRTRRTLKAEALLDKFGLSNFKKKKAKGFSKGMKRKLTIAMALINEPDILFLDEPSSGLDVQSAAMLRETIRELNENGTTIFLTTHNIEEANIMCDRVAIIVSGRIVAIDSPERLKRIIQVTQSVVVAFDSSPVSLYDALVQIPGVSHVSREGDKFRLYTDDPSAVLSLVFEYATSNNLKLLTMNTLGPSLEDVFLRLVESGKQSSEENKR
jgi:ABC-2 type transport system ATP-binding protein